MGWFDWLWGGSGSASINASASLGGNQPPPPSIPFVPQPPPHLIPRADGSRHFKRFGGPRQRIIILTKGKNAFSKNHRHSLNMQNDGNLVVYNNGQAVWSTNTNGRGGFQAIVQDDGNFVVYNAFHKPLWASQTAGNPRAELYLQDDGNLTLFRAGDRREPGDILWSSGTLGRPNGEAMALAAPPPPPPPPMFAPIPIPGVPWEVPAAPPPTTVTDMGDYDDITYYTQDNVPIQPPPAPLYWDNMGNRREERAEERAARLAQWQQNASLRSERRTIRAEDRAIARDIRHDEHGNIISAAPIIINPSRPDPSGGYHHGAGGEPVPIHPIVPPAAPDPIVIPPSRVTNPIMAPKPIISPYHPPVSAPYNPPVTPVTPPHAISAPIISPPSSLSGLDTAKSGSLESGSGSKGGSVLSGGGGGSPSHPTGGHTGVHAAGEGALGESEIGGPNIGRRFGHYKYTIAGESDGGTGGLG